MLAMGDDDMSGPHDSASDNRCPFLGHNPTRYSVETYERDCPCRQPCASCADKDVKLAFSKELIDEYDSWQKAVIRDDKRMITERDNKDQEIARLQVRNEQKDRQTEQALTACDEWEAVARVLAKYIAPMVAPCRSWEDWITWAQQQARKQHNQ